MDSNMQEMIQWARLLRLTERLELHGEVAETVRVTALDALGVKESSQQIEVKAPSLFIPDVDAGVATYLSASSRVTDDPPEEKALEGRIRHLVQASAPFHLILPALRRLLETTQSAEKAARCLELILMQQDLEPKEELLHLGLQRFPSSYFLMHGAIRNQMALQYLKTRACRPLDKLLLSYRDHSGFTPLECLYVFLALAESTDEASAFMYFKKNFKILMTVAESQKTMTGVPPSQLLLQGGKLAMDLGYSVEARDLLSQITEQGTDYETALRLLLDQRFLEKNSESSYTHRLYAAPDNRERLQLLKEFLETTRQLGGFKDRNRPELNDILQTPLSFMGEESEDWAKLSCLIVAYSDLESLLPNLFQVFRDHALTYHPPIFDLALWEGPRQMNAHLPRDRYWSGVAYLHYYVAEGPGAENELWKAKNLVENARRDFHKTHVMVPGINMISLPHDWKELHKYAFSYTSKNAQLLEIDRSRMLDQLKICQNEQTLTKQDLVSYLSQPFCPKTSKTSPDIYTRLLPFARNSPDIEYHLILRRASLTHLTNEDLHKIWRMSLQWPKPDLSWRIATILKHRGALVKQVEYAWNISGEKRSVYPLLTPSEAMALAAIKDFTPQTYRFMKALLTVGPALPELLGILDDSCRATKPKQYESASPEQKALSELVKIKWLPPPTKKYLYKEGHSNLDQLIPPFSNYLPANSWSFVLNYVAESLGIYAWRWSIKELGEKMSTLMSKVALHQNRHRQPTQVTKWLRVLTPEQKTAWQDHSSLSRTLSDSEALEALATACIRWSTLIVQNHLQALESLRYMKVPTYLIWDIEQFIVSPIYSDIRAAMNSSSRIMVPTVLQGLTSILENPGVFR